MWCMFTFATLICRESVLILSNFKEIFCIVEGGTAIHPFGRVRQAIEGHETLTATISPWTNR